jgi:multidrug efflux system membrane fusion protein
VITQIKPISVFFNVPQQQLAAINTAFAHEALPVDVLGEDNKTVVESGKLTVVDNQVDQTTGTVRLKAEFPNADLKLWPGQFVNVRLLTNTLHDVIVVPTSAVQRGPNGTFVFVVKPDQTVAVQNVSVSQQDDVQSVITGVQAGQQVVTTGFAQLAEGKAVHVSDGSAQPAAARPARGRNSARSRDGAGPEALQRRNGERRPDGSTSGERPRAQNSGSRTNASP